MNKNISSVHNEFIGGSIFMCENKDELKKEKMNSIKEF